jgi:hypothetical protein
MNFIARRCVDRAKLLYLSFSKLQNLFGLLEIHIFSFSKSVVPSGQYPVRFDAGQRSRQLSAKGIAEAHAH